MRQIDIIDRQKEGVRKRNIERYNESEREREEERLKGLKGG